MNALADSPPQLETRKATRKEWLGLAVLALPCMLYSMDLTVLNLAVPALTRDLNPSASQLLWIIDIYGFMVAGFLMVMGALGDRYGRRFMLLIGAVAFGIMSVFAAFAPSAEMLILARAALGIAGATLAPSTLSLITNMFRDESERTFAISMWIASFSAGAILGPLAGGLLLNYFWWGSVFLAGVPVMVLLLVVGPFLLPEFRGDDVKRLDYISAFLSLAAVLSFIYGVKVIAEHGPDPAAYAAIAAGLAIGVMFFLRQKRIAEPLVDLGLFKSPIFSLSLGINTLSMFFMFGTFIFTAQYLQLVAGLSALEAGFWSLPAAVAFALVSTLTARLAAWLPGARLLAAGLGVSATGFLLLYFTSSLLGVTLAMIVISVGFTPVIAMTTGYIVGAAPPEKAGVASALSETSAELGGALGIAMLGSMATFIYRGHMTSLVPPDVAPQIAERLKSSLAAAQKALESIPAEIAGPLLSDARIAHMSAFHATALLGFGALVLLAALSLRVLRGAEAGAH
jgi:DHA2 family multidrug resistance protein-like MFS transporter